MEKVINWLLGTVAVLVIVGIAVGIFFLKTYRWGSCS
jgi:hypothetical protein